MCHLSYVSHVIPGAPEVSTTDKIVAKLLCEDSSCQAAVEAQNAAICHLISDGIPGARLISSKSGRDTEEVPLTGGGGEDESALAAPTTRHILRCFEFVHGAPVGILTKVGRFSAAPGFFPPLGPPLLRFTSARLIVISAPTTMCARSREIIYEITN